MLEAVGSGLIRRLWSELAPTQAVCAYTMTLPTHSPVHSVGPVAPIYLSAQHAVVE